MSDNEKFIISVAVIGLLFITTVVYYFMLRRFMAHVRRRQESIWIDIRSNARIGETDIATSYKLLAAIKRQKYKGVKLDEVTLKFANNAKIFLYLGLSLFLIILAVGLSMSIQKG